jgi:hypothetical protein
MQLFDIISRVQFLTDDLDGTYVTQEYCAAGAQNVYDWLYQKLIKGGHDFETSIVELPAVSAGSPDLSQYQATGQPLDTLVLPRYIRWKLPGQDKTFYRLADGPLDNPRDIEPIPYLDSWSWTRSNIRVSQFSTALDLEITGDFMFDPLSSPESHLTISRLANNAFTYKLASEVGKARGNDKWKVDYAAAADEAIDDILLQMTKANQGKYERVGRMSRARSPRGPILNTR